MDIFPNFTFKNFQFSDPLFIALVMPLVAALFSYWWKTPRNITLGFSNHFFKSNISSPSFNLTSIPVLIRISVLLLIMGALMNPQKILEKTIGFNESLDIIIALDISTSMELEDITPNRLQVAKDNILKFIQKRNLDRIGLVVFGSEAFLQCPLTYDHNLLKEFVMNIDFLENISDQTAIGSAITSSVLALRGSEAKTKIIILLTDGDSNAGVISPLLAAEIANKYGIKIYSIGIGKPGQSIIYRTINDPVYGKTRVPFATVLNEKELQNISQLTGGKYFNVQNVNNFEETYQEINRLEKTKIKQEEYRLHEKKFQAWLLWGLLLLCLEIILRETYLRKLPE